VEELTAHIDFLPSLIDLTGIEFEKTNPLDGRSFAPLIFEENPEWDDRLFFTHQSRWDSLEQFPASVRNNRFRAVRYGDNWELYDMQQDPSQREDVAESNPEITEKLSKAYASWFDEVTKDLPKSRPIPVGFDASPNVYLPAVESSFSGGIQYQGKSGWSNDWLTNWKSISDKIWWELDILEEGEYRIIIEYTLRKGDEGAIIKASVKERGVNKRITEFYDPDIIPSPDRVERGEVYEKKWAQFEVGSLTLPKGKQKITIEHTVINGVNGIDLKGLILKKTG